MVNPKIAESGVALRVVPNAKRTEVIGLHGEAVKLKVASPALEGKANATVLAFVAAVAGCHLRNVHLVAGEKSRDKVVRADGLSAQELRDKIINART